MEVLHACNPRKTLKVGSAAPSHNVPGESSGAVSKAQSCDKWAFHRANRKEDDFKKGVKWSTEIRVLSRS